MSVTTYPRPELGARLRAARKRAGLSQRALARAAGISRLATANIELGSSPTVATLLALARALGVTAGHLLDGDASVWAAPSLAALAEAYRTAAGEAFVAGQDADAGAYRDAARKVEALAAKLPPLPSSTAARSSGRVEDGSDSEPE